MTETVGFFCPECASKYVQYVCKIGLPCGHDPEKAIHVYAKKFGQSGSEIVRMTGRRIRFNAYGDPEKIRSAFNTNLFDLASEGTWFPQFGGDLEAFKAAFEHRWESFRRFEYREKEIRVRSDSQGVIEFLEPKP